MSIAEDLARFQKTLEQRYDDVHAGVVEKTFGSVLDGSPLTGAPGQPVDERDLYESIKVDHEGKATTLIYTTLFRAPWAEEGMTPKRSKPFTQRSAVGGPHSFKLTRAGFPNVVEAVAIEVAFADGRGA